MHLEDLKAKFATRPKDPERLAMVKEAALQLGAVIGTIPTDSTHAARAQALSITKLEECVHWAAEQVALSET